jgi:hypothetical protein
MGDGREGRESPKRRGRTEYLGVRGEHSLRHAHIGGVKPASLVFHAEREWRKGWLSVNREGGIQDDVGVKAKRF